MMCLESDGSTGSSPGCGGRLRAGDEEEEEDGGGERGCCGRSGEGEVQTLSGRMNPPAAGKHPDRPAARHKAPSLGRARVAAAGILSVGNVLNYLDRYTVAGERGPRLPPHGGGDNLSPGRGRRGSGWPCLGRSKSQGMRCGGCGRSPDPPVLLSSLDFVGNSRRWPLFGWARWRGGVLRRGGGSERSDAGQRRGLLSVG